MSLKIEFFVEQIFAKKARNCALLSHLLQLWKFWNFLFFLIYNFCYCSVSIPLPPPPQLLKILFDLLFYIGLPNTTEKDMDLHRHVRKQHFLVCSSNSHTVFKCDVPKMNSMKKMKIVAYIYDEWMMIANL